MWVSQELLQVKDFRQWLTITLQVVFGPTPHRATQTRFPPHFGCLGQLPPPPLTAQFTWCQYVTSDPCDSGLGTLAMKCVFVTVGTTSFDDLIACVLAHDCLQVSGVAGGRLAGAPRWARHSPPPPPSVTYRDSRARKNPPERDTRCHRPFADSTPRQSPLPQSAFLQPSRATPPCLFSGSSFPGLFSSESPPPPLFSGWVPPSCGSACRV